MFCLLILRDIKTFSWAPKSVVGLGTVPAGQVGPGPCIPGQGGIARCPHPCLFQPASYSPQLFACVGSASAHSANTSCPYDVPGTVTGTGLRPGQNKAFVAVLEVRDEAMETALSSGDGSGCCPDQRAWCPPKLSSIPKLRGDEGCLGLGTLSSLQM